MADDARSLASVADRARTRGPVPGEGARVAVVVPVYGHSMLVAEAVQSVLDQDLTPAPSVVLVDDGCRLPETAIICRGLAAAHPDRVHYIRRRNGGLPAARNTGLKFVLRCFPAVSAVYFLDADNRLRSDALRNALAVLDRDPAVGWVYPNLSMFGLPAEIDYGGPFSALMLRLMNISEAGSLVRADVFRGGVLFNEAMRFGYEDWEFFLRAATEGWRGQYLDDFGLHYRRRGDSMLVAATDIDAELRQSIRRANPAAFDLKRLLSLEHAEAPRYAIHCADTGVTRFATDPASATEMISPDEFARSFWNLRSEPNGSHFPGFLVVTTEAALSGLMDVKLLHSVFWALECALESAAFAFLFGEAAPGAEVEVSAAQWAVEAGGGHVRAQFVMTKLAALNEAALDLRSGWTDTLLHERPSPPTKVVRLKTPAPCRFVEAPPIGHVLGHTIGQLRHSRWRQGADQPSNYRSTDIKPRHLLHLATRQAAGSVAATVYPRVSRKPDRNIGFVLPMMTFGGVEKVAIETARAFRHRGWNAHLFVGPASSVRHDAVEAFDSVSIIPSDIIGGWDDGRRFFGSPLPSIAQSPAQIASVAGALGWLDAVLNCHSPGVSAAMATLRRKGVVTLCHQHVIDLSASGQPVGHPYLGLAYEHAYDGLLGCSNGITNWLLGMGVPPSKLIPAPNAPGYELAPEQVSDAMLKRRARRGEGPLRVLSLGRLDRQKGVERFLDLLDLCTARGMTAAWRVVGEPVLEGASLAEEFAARSVSLPGPAQTPAALTAHYAWADVIVLLSHWEGLPLTMLEAMRLGVVPIATDVGAVREVCIDGATGRLVASDAVAAQNAARILTGLAVDRDELHRLSEAAHLAVKDRSWQDSVSPAIDFVEARLQDRNQR